MWEAKFAPDAKADLKRLDKAFAKQVLKGIAKVRKNPLPRPDGYGKPLGNKQGNNLTGFFKIKYRGNPAQPRFKISRFTLEPSGLDENGRSFILRLYARTVS